MPTPSIHPRPPSPPAHLLFGHIPQMQRDPLDLFARSSRELGDVVQLRIVQPMHLVTHPDLVKQVLQDRHFNFRKSFAYTRLSALTGRGLLTSDGENWKRQRALMQPAFHRKRLESLGAKMVSRIEQMLNGWAAGENTRVLDIHHEMTRLTLAILGDTLFSVDLLEGAARVGPAVRVALAVLNRRLLSLVPLPLFVPTVNTVRFLRARAELDRLVTRIIASRQRHGGSHDDLLDLMMAARDAGDGKRMDARQLRDEIMTLVLAGHETSAAALSWTTMLLAMAPEQQDALHEEVTRVLGGRSPTMADLPQLERTKRVVEEGLRLYPPAWLIAREATQEENLGGYRIPKGSSVFLSPWVTQRDPRFWEKPDLFDPDRFLPARSEGRPKYAYFPFAGGPRLCIGAGFAMMEMQLALAMMVQRFRLFEVDGTRAQPEANVTLAPRAGLPVRVERRG